MDILPEEAKVKGLLNVKAMPSLRQVVAERLGIFVIESYEVPMKCFILRNLLKSRTSQILNFDFDPKTIIPHVRSPILSSISSLMTSDSFFRFRKKRLQKLCFLDYRKHVYPLRLIIIDRWQKRLDISHETFVHAPKFCLHRLNWPIP